MPGRSFRITPGDPAAYSYSVESSATGSAPWAETDNILASALTDLGGGEYRLDAPLAPTDEYVRLIPEDAAGLTSPPNTTYPPHPVNPGTFSVYAYTVDAGLGVAEGIRLVAKPVVVGSMAVPADSRTVVTPKIVLSDAAGYAIIDGIPADSGDYIISLNCVEKWISTTGLAGQTIRWNDLT